MIEVLDPKQTGQVFGGISVPNAGNRTPSGNMSMSDAGTAISIVSMFAGLTPAGAIGRSVIFAAGAIGMGMGLADNDS